MVNMGFLLNDKMLMDDYLESAFNRRRQLCPFTLAVDELIDVQHSPSHAKVVRYMVERVPKLLHWDSGALLLVADPDHPREVLKVRLRLKTPVPLAVAVKGPVEAYVTDQAEVIRCWNGPQTSKLRDWAWKATQVELENRWAMRIVRKLTTKATTHQQVHRYMPEIYSLLVGQEAASFPNRNSWTGKRFERLAEGLKELGSSRAQKLVLDGVTVQDRSNLKALVVHTLLLPPHQGLEKGSELDATWIEP